MGNSKSVFQKGWFGTQKRYVSDVLEYSSEYSVKIIRKFIGKLPKGKKILDVGCADGELLAEFVGKHQICGVDIASNLVDLAVKKGLTAKTANLEKRIPYQDNFFDVLVIHHVLEHILNTDRFLSECNRVLKRNGILLLTFPNVASPLSFLLLLLDLPGYQAARYKSLHVRDFTLRTVKIALENNGFKPEKYFGGSLLILKNNFLAIISQFFHRFAAEITILARKVKTIKKNNLQPYDLGPVF